MRRQAIVALMIALGLVACDENSSADAPTARSLARQLERAGVCTDAHPSRQSDNAPATQTVDLTGKPWSCNARRSDTTARGGIQVGLWAARNAAAKTRVLRRMTMAFDSVCAAPPSGDVTGSNILPPGTRIFEQYVEGDTWVALVGTNARFKDVASALHGRAVTKQCRTR